MSTCVDPILGYYGDWISGLPTSIKMEDYGMRDLELDVIYAAGSKYMYIEDYMVISMPNSPELEEQLDEYFSTKWIHFKEGETPYEYIRGISFAVKSSPDASTIELLIVKDKGITGWPDVPKLNEYQIADMPTYSNFMSIDRNSISHAIDLTPEIWLEGQMHPLGGVLDANLPNSQYIGTYKKDATGKNIIKGFSLTLMIYDTMITEYDVINYKNYALEHLNSEREDEYRPGFKKFVATDSEGDGGKTFQAAGRLSRLRPDYRCPRLP